MAATRPTQSVSNTSNEVRGSDRVRFRAIVVSVLWALSFAQPATAAEVQSLTLPDGYTIAPEGEHRLISVGRDGSIFAITSDIDEKRAHPRAARWIDSAGAEAFTPREIYPPPYPPYADAVVALDANDAYVTVSQTFAGAHIHTLYEIQRWANGSTTRWMPPECVPRSDSGPHIFSIDADGRMAVTIDSSAGIIGVDFSNPRSVEHQLPIAVIVHGGNCKAMGRAILTAVDGNNVAGYRGYLDGRAAPWFVNVMAQKMVAVRWIGGREDDPGPGVPFAINRSGMAAGATALPGHGGEFLYGNFFGPGGRYEYATPHAVAWSSDGTVIALTRNDTRSVAWDISEDDTIVGTEQLHDGKHYAFRWQHGHIVRLDDLPHPAGWRFESAYAIARDGSIVGIGRLNGVPTAFIWRN